MTSADGPTHDPADTDDEELILDNNDHLSISCACDFRVSGGAVDAHRIYRDHDCSCDCGTSDEPDRKPKTLSGLILLIVGVNAAATILATLFNAILDHATR